jgi:hypothetical protein
MMISVRNGKNLSLCLCAHRARAPPNSNSSSIFRQHKPFVLFLPDKEGVEEVEGSGCWWSLLLSTVPVL